LTGPRFAATGLGRFDFTRDFWVKSLLPFGLDFLLPVFEERFCVPPDVEKDLVDFPFDGVTTIAGDFVLWLFDIHGTSPVLKFYFHRQFSVAF
jgi:hypothetical protein